MGNTYDLRTKIDRAIRALLTGTGVGLPGNVHAGEASLDNRTLPNTTIDAGEGYEKDFTGNYRFENGRIIFHDSAIVQANDQNPEGPFVAAQKRVSAIIGQLVQTEDGTTMDYSRQLINAYGQALANVESYGGIPNAAQLAANNSDMCDFALTYWRITDYGNPKKVGGDRVYYERIVSFECEAANSNVG